MARVTRDVRSATASPFPPARRRIGEVTLVERGARVRERARLGVRFTSIVLADGTRVPIDTEPIYREGDSPRNEKRRQDRRRRRSAARSSAASSAARRARPSVERSAPAPAPRPALAGPQRRDAAVGVAGDGAHRAPRDRDGRTLE